MSECVLCSGDSSKLSGAFEIYEPDEWLLNAAGYLQGAETWSFSYKGKEIDTIITDAQEQLQCGIEYKDTDIYKLLVELVDKNISFVMWYDEFWESIDLFSDIKEILKVCYEQILDKSGMCEVYIWYNGTKTMEDANNNS
jgi:hypothetical protein